MISNTCFPPLYCFCPNHPEVVSLKLWDIFRSLWTCVGSFTLLAAICYLWANNLAIVVAIFNGGECIYRNMILNYHPVCKQVDVIGVSTLCTGRVVCMLHDQIVCCMWHESLAPRPWHYSTLSEGLRRSMTEQLRKTVMCPDVCLVSGYFEGSDSIRPMCQNGLSLIPMPGTGNEAIPEAMAIRTAWLVYRILRKYGSASATPLGGKWTRARVLTHY